MPGTSKGLRSFKFREREKKSGKKMLPVMHVMKYILIAIHFLDTKLEQAAWVKIDMDRR